jgi:hypothetical protein
MGFGSVFQIIGDSGAGDYGQRGVGAVNAGTKQAVGALQPWADAGTNALAGYGNLLNNPNAVRSDPGYQFRFDEGQKALTNNALAKGSFFSGNTGRALTEYGQNFATNEYDQALQRFFPMLSLGSGASNNIAKLYSGQGNALADIYGKGDAVGIEDEIRKMKAAESFGDSLFSMGMGAGG